MGRYEYQHGGWSIGCRPLWECMLITFKSLESEIKGGQGGVGGMSDGLKPKNPRFTNNEGSNGKSVDS